MDWVHCNTCGVQPTANMSTVFRLTSCGHIFCQFCEKEKEIEECKICRNKDVTMINLSSEMKPDIQVYFEDPTVLASQLLKVVEFQKGHRLRFLQILQRRNQKYNFAKMHIAKLEERMKKEIDIKTKIIEQNKCLMRELESYKNQGFSGEGSPILNYDRPIFTSNSHASKLIRSAAENLPSNRNIQQQSLIQSPFSNYSTPRENYQTYRNPKTISSSITPISFTSDSSGTPYSCISHTKSVCSDSSDGRHPMRQKYQSNFAMAGRTPPNINRLKIANIPPRRNS